MRVGHFHSRLFVYPGFGIRGESSVCHCHLELESLNRERINSSVTLMVMDLPLVGLGVGVRQHFEGTFHQGNE